MEVDEEGEEAEEEAADGYGVELLDGWGEGRGGTDEALLLAAWRLLRFDRPYSGMMSPCLLSFVLHTGQSAWPACSL